MAQDDRSRSPRDADGVNSVEPVEQPRTFDGADGSQTPSLGEGLAPNVDLNDFREADNPEDDWGEPAGEGALYGANHTRRPERTEALRGQGVKTRRMTKDIISRRI